MKGQWFKNVYIHWSWLLRQRKNKKQSTSKLKRAAVFRVGLRNSAVLLFRNEVLLPDAVVSPKVYPMEYDVISNQKTIEYESVVWIFSLTSRISIFLSRF